MIQFLKNFFFPKLFKDLETPRLWVRVNKFHKSKKDKENTIMKVISDLDREMIIKEEIDCY